MTNEQLTKLKELNEAGYTQREMMAYFQCPRWTIQRNLYRMGLHTPNYHNACKFNEHVFDTIDTEEKAYWLGFLYADGNVGSKNNHIEVSLKLDDYNHLEKLKKFFDTPSTIQKREVKCNGKICHACRLTVSSKHLKSVLMSYGCVPNKSLILTFPDLQIFADKKLVYDFIRGYVDGDGCISFTKNGRPDLSIVGTESFITSIKDIFPNKFGKIITDKRTNVHHIGCTCKKAYSVLTKLYKNCSISLDRKYARFAVLASNCQDYDRVISVEAETANTEIIN